MLKEDYKKIAKKLFPKASIEEVGDCLIIKKLEYKVRKPSREYSVGWIWEINFSENMPKTNSIMGWNEPEYNAKVGCQEWNIENPPEKLKTKNWGGAWARAADKFYKSSEMEIVLPNGLLARWNPWKDMVVGWGEVPKLKRINKLNRNEMKWDVFLEIQKTRHGEEKKLNFQKDLLLIRDLHAGFIKKYETDESMRYKKIRKEKIQQARDRLNG